MQLQIGTSRKQNKFN